MNIYYDQHKWYAFLIPPLDGYYDGTFTHFYQSYLDETNEYVESLIRAMQ